MLTTPTSSETVTLVKANEISTSSINKLTNHTPLHILWFSMFSSIIIMSSMYNSSVPYYNTFPYYPVWPEFINVTVAHRIFCL